MWRRTCSTGPILQKSVNGQQTSVLKGMKSVALFSSAAEASTAFRPHTRAYLLRWRHDLLDVGHGLLLLNYLRDLCHLVMEKNIKISSLTIDLCTNIKCWPSLSTDLDLLGTSGFLGLSDGCSGEKLGLDPWLELSGGCIGHLLLLLCRLSCLHCHLLGSDLKKTLLLILMRPFSKQEPESKGLPHLLLNCCLSLLWLSCFLLGCSCGCGRLLFLNLK